MKKIQIGVIGSKDAVSAALIMLANSGYEAHEVEDNKPEPIKITAPELIDPISMNYHNHKKSKGEKRRERSERRRKWGI
jgi:hypothetical protein